jgi:hypothetical protein
MNTLEIIKARLEQASVSTGQSGNWPSFIGHFPDVQVQQIGIQFSGGFPDDTHGSENRIQKVVVTIRAENHDICEAKWNAMHAALNNAEDVGSPSMYSRGIRFIQSGQGAPAFFIDSRSRCVMTDNYRIVRDNT